MTVGKLKKLLSKLDDSVEVNISDRAITGEEARWWDIKCLYTNPVAANELGQVCIMLKSTPVMY